MFMQSGAISSAAQESLRDLARKYVAEFEERVSYVEEADPKRVMWHPLPLEPTRTATLGFARSVHPSYPEVPAFLNTDERQMALTLDQFADGWWMRNPPTASQGGYSIPLPVQVAGSQAFFPDFLWWIDAKTFAIDTSGIHLLDAKVRGKLMTLDSPKLVFVTRGRVAPTFDTLESQDGWTLIRSGPSGAQRPYFEDLSSLLSVLRAG